MSTFLALMYYVSMHLIYYMFITGSVSTQDILMGSQWFFVFLECYPGSVTTFFFFNRTGWTRTTKCAAGLIAGEEEIFSQCLGPVVTQLRKDVGFQLRFCWNSCIEKKKRRLNDSTYSKHIFPKLAKLSFTSAYGQVGVDQQSIEFVLPTMDLFA